jgi:hypothetical protein
MDGCAKWRFQTSARDCVGGFTYIDAGRVGLNGGGWPWPGKKGMISNLFSDAYAVFRIAARDV